MPNRIGEVIADGILKNHSERIFEKKSEGIFEEVNKKVTQTRAPRIFKIVLNNVSKKVDKESPEYFSK